MATKNVKPQPEVVDVFKQTGIYLSGAHSNQISEYLGGVMVKTFEELLDRLKKTQKIRINGDVDIVMSADDLAVIRGYADGMGRPYEEYLKEFIEDAIGMAVNGCTPVRY